MTGSWPRRDLHAATFCIVQYGVSILITQKDS